VTDPSSFTGGGAALAAAASWAISTTIVKGAIHRFGPRAFNLFRCTIALAFFWVTALVVDGSGALRAMATRDGLWLLLSGAAGLAIGDAFLFETVRRLGAQSAVAMNQLSPIWSALLGLAIGSERLSASNYSGIAVVLAGVLMIVFGKKRAVTGDDAPHRPSAAGFACGVASSMCNAGAGMVTHGALAPIGAVNVVDGSTLRMTGGAVALVVLGFATGRMRNDLRPLRALGALRKELFAIFLATFLGIFLQQVAYSRLEASVALTLLSTTPLFLMPLAVLVLHEQYRRRAWFGTLLATAGLPLLFWSGSECKGVDDAMRNGKSATNSDLVVDPHSFSRPDEARVVHLDLDLRVDFERHELVGRASLEVSSASGASGDAQRILSLDTRSLAIERVTTSPAAPRLGAPKDERPAKFTLGPADPKQAELGRALTVELAPGSKCVNVYYKTSPGAAALQWLEPAQTAGGEQPFLFTQSQAILARTWVPCQDTPSVRATYTARVTVPRRLLALMSAENPQARRDDGVYTFEMPQPVPSYLLALAVGDLAFAPVSARTGVYAEPSRIEKARYEFDDLERMVAAAEQLYGPYRWGRYDLIVLPPSFPFGGMENPRLTFATPTVVAGDRSLVSLVAHELAHSWSGNLVTNATWDDFWLNEGFTVYFEHRIMEALYGREFDDALLALGLQDLERTIADLKEQGQAADTCLKLKLAGRNPDDGVTEVAYEKGARLLRTIEAAVGRARFDVFLRKWFDSNAFQSRTTEQFLEFLRAELGPELAKKGQSLERDVQLDAWIYGEGLPSNCPRVESAALAKAEQQVARFVAGTPAAQLDTKGFTTQQWQSFLRRIPASATAQQMSELDAAFGLSSRGNSEVLFAWLAQCVAHRHEPAFPALERFLTSQGRRKFLKPLYQELAKSEWGRALAKRIYEKARPTYHAVSRDTIDALLQWKP
jgi:drug/metabolite transporter (DMT)-like permease